MSWTKDKIDEIIKRAGLEGVVDIYGSAIEFGSYFNDFEHLPKIDMQSDEYDHREDGYRILAAILQADREAVADGI